MFLDFNDALKLEPDNKQAKQELNNIKKQVWDMGLSVIEAVDYFAFSSRNNKKWNEQTKRQAAFTNQTVFE